MANWKEIFETLTIKKLCIYPGIVKKINGVTCVVLVWEDVNTPGFIPPDASASTVNGDVASGLVIGCSEVDNTNKKIGAAKLVFEQSDAAIKRGNEVIKLTDYQIIPPSGCQKLMIATAGEVKLTDSQTRRVSELAEWISKVIGQNQESESNID